MLRSQNLAWIELRTVALTLFAESYSLAFSLILALNFCGGQDMDKEGDRVKAHYTPCTFRQKKSTKKY
jgi:hypothetical protein